MRSQEKKASKTKTELLLAASELFAEKGYTDTTVAEICQKAGANIAAINYHFGDKETLYREAWRESFNEAIKVYPPDGGVKRNEPPEARLRGAVVALLGRISDEKTNREFRIVQKELANPTGLIEEVMSKEIEPQRQKMETIIRELLGPEASDTQVNFCIISIISQCINPMAVNKRAHPAEDQPPGIDDIETFADHVVTFSIGGVKELLAKHQRDEEEE
jgi:TetR/AcrR family transcriptional regulator, regulator of cefoperazone and chloramphenicol sensitivity